ncbi:hypothetical protein ACLBYD_27630 [Rhodococcus sp. C26F]
MARSARQNADEVTAHDLVMVVQALTGQVVDATDMDKAERREDQHDQRATNLSARSTPSSERHRRK